ncbi:hypothetical protein Dalk_4583 [Desulfatibacillum aliphaticivorans]|uniref:DUF6378 domain-containing protein n=1 Tax=Desulfatibacillum aliphaticivorans TaxID=218208 RepID=B8FNI0_DESAL|nr:DUF6378 domain-containing protein [Desulfatibacillum aliphaticivorans]ACL06261.1 hypothetical protein Dalk_4583 [Desulfatibacillum aliphaticivorans]
MEKTCQNCGYKGCDYCGKNGSPCLSWIPDCLAEADHIINGERQDSYGAPEDSFALIAGHWSTYLGRELSALDVAHMMMLFKIARMSGQKPCRDNYVDLAGYTAIAADRLLPKAEKEN